MLVIIDTSAIIAVLVNEPERAALVDATLGAELAAPGSVHWEVGNALSALLKRRRATLTQAQQAIRAYAAIPIRFMEVDLALALDLASTHDLYAYDAYLIACALAQKAPLLTLDKGLQRAARVAGIEILELRP
ncbi:MAG: type II toxin-antitoxin system VapC family toxin [Ardenticatenia bacterium]|nr:type II toxin-antitoxin system VapC family toxin [Ardenticatenia bacterium]